MRSRTQSIDSRDLQRQAEQRTRKLRGLACRRFAAELLEPIIRFDLRGKSAGQVRAADAHTCLIRYNARLLERYPREFLAQTVPHETAHLVTFSLFGSQSAPHGSEWQSIMALFGASAKRCHDYEVADLQTRRLRRYAYRCACRTHWLTSIRHKRIGGGQIYLCRRCGQPLQPDAEGGSS